MKEPYTEGVANHGDPESCAGPREGVGEALTGERVGRVLSPEITKVRTPTLSQEAEGHTARGVERLPQAGPAGSETPRMRGRSMRGNREVHESPTADGAAGRAGKARAMSQR